MYKCPKCKSTRIYQEVSVVAKRNVNTERVYDVNKEYIDGDYTEYLYCDKCGYEDEWEKFEVS